MRIALINTDPKTKYYPIALLKIGAWLKDKGNDCKIFNNTLPKAKKFDEIWVTTCFTFDLSHSVGIVKEAVKRAKIVKVGGIAASLLPKYFEREGAEVHKGLIAEAEKFPLDYSLLDKTPEYSITHITRGCVRKCGFCMVTKLEPKFYKRDNWEKDIHPKAPNVLFYDNNWLAQPLSAIKKDAKKIKALVDEGKIKDVDFNQGLDARLMTKEKADAIKGIPIPLVRFAFDNKEEDGHYQKAVELMVERGYSLFMSYMLYNFKDKPEFFYYRVRETVRLQEKMRKKYKLKVHTKLFPMRYQPILEINKRRDFIGEHWTEIQKKGIPALLRSASQCGELSLYSIKEFEYWFGKNDKEFMKLLSYPKLLLLLQRRKEYLRKNRQKILYD